MTSSSNRVLQLNERKNAVQWYLHCGDGFSVTANKSILKYLLEIERLLFYQMQGEGGLDLSLYISALHNKLEVAMATQAWTKCSARELMAMTPRQLLALNGEHVSFDSLLPPEEVQATLPDVKVALGLGELRHAILCSKCKSTKHGVKEETAQIRAADEGLTALYTCQNPLCRFSWRSG